jgi:hypothetical protein
MNKEVRMNKITPNLTFLTNASEILAEQTRLSTRNLLSEVIAGIHEYHDADPDGAHIVTRLDDTDDETLSCRECVCRESIFRLRHSS